MSDGDERAALAAAVAGRYALERELGRGGMGVVFLARDLALERTVAIKLLPRGLATDPVTREGFLREARTAAGLSHPNIVSIHLVEQHGDVVYFVMAHIDGETLAERVRRAGRLGLADALRLLQEVAWALAYAHGRGVVHRDVKPENIMLERLTGRAMVTDFGIAQRGDGQAGDVVGTAQFMSPEQAQGAAVDARSDLYSLGVTAFYALTGTLPFDGSTYAAVLGQHVARPAPRVLDARPGLPPRLAAAVDRCLAKAPRDRFPTGEALAEEIGALRETIPQIPPLIRRLQRSFLLIPALGTAFAVVMTWVALMAPQAAGAMALLFGALFTMTVMDFVSHTRLVRASGFTQDDVVAGFMADARQRQDEQATGGQLLAALGHPAVVTVTVLMGFAGLLLGLELPELGVRSPHWRVKLAFAGTFLLALMLPVALSAPGRAKAWGRLWSGAVGRFWFGLAGVGLRTRSGG